MIDFNELYLKRTKASDKQKSYVILALDPGNTTGFCIFDITDGVPRLKDYGQITTVKDDIIQWDSLTKFFDEHFFNIMVCENYRIYQQKLERHSFSPVLTLRLIGGIEYYASIHEVPIHYQMASQAKAFVTDEKLRHWEFYQEGMKHCRDAIRHAIYFMLFHK